MAPGLSGAISNHVVYCTLSIFSIGRMDRYVKLHGEIISAFSPQKKLSSTIGRMTRRDSNPHLRLGQSAMFPLHHGP
jgi:hypothetical protein